MAQNQKCKLCLNVNKKNVFTKINSLPKTFTIILEEMSGTKFTKAEALEMVICTKCLNFLKNMENSSTRPKSNKISEEGKKRVFRLMEKKRIPTAQAIEIVLAEQRARDLLMESGLKASDAGGNLQSVAKPNQLPKPKLSGAQRKKAGILIDAGMDPEAARQLVYAASIANKNNGDEMTNIMQEFNNQWGLNEQWGANNQWGPNNQRGSSNQRRSRQQNAKGPQPQRAAGQGQNKKLPQSGVAQIGKAKPAGVAQIGGAKPAGVAQIGKAKPVQKTPVQRVAPVRGVAQKAAPGPKVLNQKVPNQKAPVVKKIVTTSPGILVPLNKRQNNNSRGVRGGANSSDNRVGGPVQNSHRNDRSAPYNVNRQQNQSQHQNNNFNQHQQQQRQQQNNSFEVGIVPINYPNVMLDDLKLDALKEAITNEILKIPQGGPLIRFLGTSSQNGWLKITCADELSYNWLSMLVSRWERAGVRMVEGNSMPQSPILSFYLQGDFRSPDEILSIIDKQNISLNANQWRIMNRESDGNGQCISVCVDEQCFQALRSRDFIVFLGLGVVELKPRNSASNNVSFSNNNSNNNSSSQNFMGNDNGNFLNSGGNNMQGGRGGMGNNNKNNYQSVNSGGRGGNGGFGNNNNYQTQGQGYQWGGGYQNQGNW